MYKVMLVDDEKLITQGLLNLIEWENLNLEVVNTAQNGEEALEKFKENPVNIVVTDINMPKMSGLDLIKEIKAIDEGVNFIILSGYDEFSYAKKAIAYGVESYILKPINEEELEESLISIVKSIKLAKKNKNNILDKNRKLIEFINGKINKEEIYKIKEDINLDFNEKYYTVATITISKRNEDGKYINIDEIIEENTLGNYEIIHKFDGQTILVNSWNEGCSREEIIEYYNRIKDKLINTLNVDVFIAIGDTVDSIDKLKNSYRVACRLKKYMLTEGTNMCLYKEKVSDIEEYRMNFSSEIDKLNKLIIEKNINKTKDYLTEIFDNSKLTPRNIYDLSVKIIILIDNISDEFKLDKKYVRDSLSSTIVELCNESTRDSVKTFIISEVEEVINAMCSNTIKYSPIVQQIINNINDRYYEELSLKTLAQQYNINSSYLGRIFSKEVGMSFSEYLNKTKNIKAKDLILETNMKINDIAKAIGYTDTSYFYRKFKKYYGVCPSTLREMKNY
ncbi:response regulator transcription factor [Clostridium sardiniense]|uniref:Stage 0 sporulation protein A homolog n=1 Tax=Clostridium sardiniense TaxID=29369 RepID=A0ABS7KV69_CLOSR|nr:response regulator transcription factor [Clostridium sardiniense]MBY0754711.1 response regulator transcription factor [Clostridium sardiniense]MDQ0460569.1 two-component system response regulator YesN [Clostridium sardiniense]